MNAKVRHWVEANCRPADLYELLGRPRFDPNIGELREAIRTAYAELLLYQNHADPRVAQRVSELQRELGTAEIVLSDPARLREYHEAMFAKLHDLYARTQATAAEDWDLQHLQSWLRRQQAVHPEQLASVVEAVVVHADQGAGGGHLELEEDGAVELIDSGGWSGGTSAPAEDSSHSRPGAITPLRGQKHARSPVAAMIGAETRHRRNWSSTVTATVLRTKLRISITITVVVTAGLAGTCWLLLLRPTADREESRPSVCHLVIEPADAQVEAVGQDARVVGTGRQRSLIVTHPDSTKKVILIATKDGCQLEKRELSPSPGEERKINIRMRPLPTPPQVQEKTQDVAVPAKNKPDALAETPSVPSPSQEEKKSSGVLTPEDHKTDAVTNTPPLPSRPYVEKQSPNDLVHEEQKPGILARSLPSVPSRGSNDRMPEIADAIALFRRRDFDGTLAILKSAVARNPDLPPANVIMAQLFSQASEVSMMRVALEKASVEAPNDPEAFMILAELSLREGHVTEASATLSKARQLLGTFDGSTKRRGLLELRLNSTLAGVAEACRDWPLAQRHYEDILKIQPMDVQAMQRLARALSQQGKYRNALEVLKKARNIDPRILLPEARLALFLEERKEHVFAKQWMSYALKAAPQDCHVYLAAGQWALETGEIADAEAYAKQAIQMAPDLPETMMLRGVVALFQRDYETAETCYERAYLQSPSNSRAANNLVLALCDQDDSAKIRRALDFADINRKKYPKEGEVVCTYAWVLYKVGRLQEAEQQLRLGLSLGHVSPDTGYYCARVCLDQGRKDESRRLLEAAVKNPRPFWKQPESLALLTELAPDSPWAFHAGDTVVVYSAKAKLLGKDKDPKLVPPGTVLRVVEIRKKQLLVELDGQRGEIEAADVAKK